MNETKLQQLWITASWIRHKIQKHLQETGGYYTLIFVLALAFDLGIATIALLSPWAEQFKDPESPFFWSLIYLMISAAGPVGYEVNQLRLCRINREPYQYDCLDALATLIFAFTWIPILFYVTAFDLIRRLVRRA